MQLKLHRCSLFIFWRIGVSLYTLNRLNDLRTDATLILDRFLMQVTQGMLQKYELCLYQLKYPTQFCICDILSTSYNTVMWTWKFFFSCLCPLPCNVHKLRANYSWFRNTFTNWKSNILSDITPKQSDS